MCSILLMSGNNMFGIPVLSHWRWGKQMGKTNDRPRHFVKAQPAVVAGTGSRQC